MTRVLIIEDEKPLREAFIYLLKSEGYEVEWAENGRVGLRKLSTFNPQLVLLDMLMPVMDGMAFLKEAQLPKAHPHVKTVLLSNLSDAITFDDAHLYGVTVSVLKADLSPAELVATVKKVLSNSS